MFKHKKLLTYLAGGLIVALHPACATSVWSATKPEVSVDFVTSAKPLLLQDIMDVDELGFDCIREELIDVAFHATGKGMRMPRTCLPEPCAKALEPEELALLIGRKATEEEWDQYFSRYSEVCRKEVTPFDKDEITIVTGSDDPLEEFWTPLIETYITTNKVPKGGTSITTKTKTPRGKKPLPVFWPKPPTSFIKTPPPETPDHISWASSNASSGLPTPAPVPLPAAVWLLLLGLASLAPWKRRQTRVS